MTYYPDLSPFRYGFAPAYWGADGPPGVEPTTLYWWPGDGLGEGAFAVPELNVGWLDSPHEFPRAPMEPELVQKLQRLCTESRYRMMRGWHGCKFCHDPEAMSSCEIRIQGKNVVYAAPQLIAHYVAAHQYAPPAEFVTALRECDGLAQPDPAVRRPVTLEMIPREPVSIPHLQARVRAKLEEGHRQVTFPDVSMAEEGDDVLIAARIVPRPGAQPVSRTWRIPSAALLNPEQAEDGVISMLNRAHIHLGEWDEG